MLTSEVTNEIIKLHAPPVTHLLDIKSFMLTVKRNRVCHLKINILNGSQDFFIILLTFPINEIFPILSFELYLTSKSKNKLECVHACVCVCTKSCTTGVFNLRRPE